MSSHIIRHKRLQEIHDQFIRLVNEGCYPLILEISNEYKKWIKQQAEIDQELQRIRTAYEGQSQNHISVNELRQVINDAFEKLRAGHANSSMLDQSTMHESNDSFEIPSNHPLTSMMGGEASSYGGSTISIDTYSTKTQQTIRQAEENANALRNMIRQLHQRPKNQARK